MSAVTTSNFELASRLRLVITRTARRLRQEAGEGVSPSQLAALATLERHGPLSPSELADREQVKRPTATRVIGRLVEADLAERTADPGDRRCALISVTAAGRALLRRLRERKTAYLAQRLHQLDPEEEAALERAVEVLEQLLEGEMTGTSAASRRGGPG
ncbi:MAG: MarR family transcriptional regulator [Solirubrobacterales bacterium]